MMLDVHGPVAGPVRRGHEEVRFADPATGRIGGQAPTHDQVRAGLHRVESGLRPIAPVSGGDHPSAGVQRKNLGDDLPLEMQPAGE